MPQTVQLLRTSSNNPPGPLLPGELSLELGGQTKLWSGAIAGNRLLISSDPNDAGGSAAGGAFLPLRGGTLSGGLTVQTAGAALATVLAKSTVAQSGAGVGVYGTAGGFGFVSRSSNGAGIAWGPLNADGSPAFATNAEYMMWSGDRITVNRMFFINNVPLVMLGAGGILTLAADPVQPLEAATMRYVDAGDAAITAELTNYLPLLGGDMQGQINLPGVPTADAHATNKYYVDLQDSILQEQIDLLTDNLVFSGQISVPNDSGQYTAASGIPDGPLPAPSASLRGFYVIVNTGGQPPGVSNIPQGTYARGDWLICDGTIWVELHLGLTSVIAPEVALSPAIPNLGANVQTALTYLQANYLPLSGAFAMTGGLNLGTAEAPSANDLTRHIRLWGNNTGFNVFTSALQYNVQGGMSHLFRIIGGADLLRIQAANITALVPLVANSTVTLSTDPLLPMQAATRQYVDNAVAGSITGVEVDGVSIIGDGTPNFPLEAYALDAGTY